MEMIVAKPCFHLQLAEKQTQTHTVMSAARESVELMQSGDGITQVLLID